MLNRTLDWAREGLPVAGAQVAASLSVNGYLFRGANSLKTHPLQKKFGKNDHAIHLHAEIDCIREALRSFRADELSKATMYVARAKKDGSPGLAKPCEGCQRAIIAFGVKEVYWTE